MAEASGRTRAVAVGLLGGGGLVLALALAGAGVGGLLPPSPEPGTAALPSPLEPIGYEFRRTEEGIVLSVRFVQAGARPAGPARVLLDGREVLTWDAEPATAAPGGELVLTVRHPFREGRSYALRVEDDQERYRTIPVAVPDLPERLQLQAFQPRWVGDGTLAVEVDLRAAGYERVTLLLEAWSDFAPDPESNRTAYVLTESLSEGARAYAEAFLRWARRLDPPLRVLPLDREGLAELSRGRDPATVIVFTPLEGHRGPVEDALPVEFLLPWGPTEEGLEALRDRLRRGLVLLTPTTTHPLRALLTADGRLRTPPTAATPGVLLVGRLSTWWSQTARLTREGAAARALLEGHYQGEYGGVAELAGPSLYGYREFQNAFEAGPEAVRGRPLRLYNPFFLRSGRGGWLAFAHRPPAPETLGRDLTRVLLHAPWRGTALGVPNPGWAETVPLRGGARALARRAALELPRDGQEDDRGEMGELTLRLLVLAEGGDRWVWREWLRRVPLPPGGGGR